jgi:hypothetical protein
MFKEEKDNECKKLIITIIKLYDKSYKDNINITKDYIDANRFSFTFDSNSDFNSNFNSNFNFNYSFNYTFNSTFNFNFNSDLALSKTFTAI